LDLNQANFVIGLPVGYGLGFEGGKFDTLVGYEVIDSPSNPLFSHSLIFTQEPLTQTGALAIYNVTDPTSANVVVVEGGFSRGWDQATKDNNGSIDYTGQIAYTKNDTTTSTMIYSLTLTAITGDETASGPQDGWRTLIDFVGKYNFSDQLSFGVNGMYACQAQTANGGFGGGTGEWYGAALYAKYLPPNIGSYLALNARVEWLDDNDGAAITQYAGGTANSNIPNQFYEATIGVAVTPLPNDANLKGLTIRPELRWDYSDHSAFDGATQHDQWTAGVEAYFTF
jgi:hypothetical protein